MVGQEAVYKICGDELIRPNYGYSGSKTGRNLQYRALLNAKYLFSHPQVGQSSQIAHMACHCAWEK